MLKQEKAVSALARFFEALMDEEVCGWREAVEIREAWNAGLSWFVNLSGGDTAYRAYQSLLAWQDGRFDGLPEGEE